MKSSIRSLGLILAAGAAAVLLLLILFQGAMALAANGTPPPTPEEQKATLPSIDIAGRGHYVLVANQSFTNTTDYPNYRPGSVSVINTASGAVYGPFLEGKLGNADFVSGVFDIALAPDGVTALVANFGDHKAFIVDFSIPISPSVVATVTLPEYAEDVDFTQDGRFGLVTGAGYSEYVGSINMLTHALAYSNVLTGTYHNAVEAAADGTIVTVDYFDSLMHTLSIDAAGMVSTVNTYTLAYLLPGSLTAHAVRPVNVAIAPDNQTIIVADATTSTLPIYRLTEPGVVTFVGVVTKVGLLPGIDLDYDDGTRHYERPQAQSVAFDEAGEHAYVLLNNYHLQSPDTTYPNHVAVLDITGPGQVTRNPAAPIPLAGQYSSTSQMFGIDVLTVAGRQLYVSHPSTSGHGTSNPLQVVNLDNYSTYTVTTGLEDGTIYYLPMGVASMPLRLDMAKTADLTVTHPGEKVTYTLSLVNPGPQLSGLSVGDVLPAGLSLAGAATIDPPTAGILGGTAADLAHDVTIAANGRVTITYPAVAAPLAVGTVLTNTAWADNPTLLTQAAQAVNAISVVSVTNVVSYTNFLPAIHK